MIGCCVVGAIAAVGLAKLFFRARCGWYGGGGCHRGPRRWGHHGHHGWGPYRGGDPLGDHDDDGASARGYGPWEIFSALDLTREQRRALRDLRTEWVDATRSARSSAHGMKEDVASVLRAETFDEGIVGASVARFDELADALKKATLSSLAKAHQILEPAQRQRLADLLERGRGRAPWAL
jgi:Spy/CpxP family protein refolding chaperone